MPKNDNLKGAKSDGPEKRDEKGANVVAGPDNNEDTNFAVHYTPKKSKSDTNNPPLTDAEGDHHFAHEAVPKRKSRKNEVQTSISEASSHTAAKHEALTDEIITVTPDTTDIGDHFEVWRPLSWSSIFIGAIVALAISAALHILGIGITASSVDGEGKASDTLMMVGGVTGILFLVATAVSLFIGGFVASTLAHNFTNSRPAVYGLAVWALTTLVSVAIIGPALVNGAGNALNAAGTVADRTARTLGTVGSTAVQSAQNAPAGLIDRVQRTLIGTTNTQLDAGAAQEITSLVTQRIYEGSWTSQQREQLNNSIAKAANIPVDDARRRVDEAQATIERTVQQASEAVKRTAEAARVGIAGSAYWAFASMLVGFLAAFFGARYGALDESSIPHFARLTYRRVPQNPI